MYSMRDDLTEVVYTEKKIAARVEELKKDVSSSITGKHVLVIEDIYDTGNSMQFLVNFLASKNPKSISTAVLLRKDVENQIPFDIDYLAFHCPNEFIVGYGLDYAQKYRNLPYIGILKPEIYLS